MNKIRKTKWHLVLLAAVMLITTSCTGGKDKTANLDGDIDLSSYPIETDVTLTYFKPLRSSLAGMVENLSETQFAQEYVKRTGVNIEYIHPAIGQDNEMLSLLIASNELPDIMQSSWVYYTDGVTTALDDNIIIDIGEYKEYAPAFFGKLESEAELDRAAKTDDGRYYGFQSIQRDAILRNTGGPVFRADWLKELGLDVPTKISEYEEILKAFREKKGATAPLSVANMTPHLFSMFGVHNGLYIEDGKYEHGQVEPEIKEAFRILNDWFEKGLLDKNFVSVDQKMLDSQVLTGKTGVFYASGGDVGRFLSASTDTNFDLVAAPFPSYKGDEPNDAMSVGLPITGTCVAAISGQCKYPALAAKVLDYLYTEEGQIFANFGTEGVSYNMVDAVPTYTDVIVNNPDGLSVMEALGLHVAAGATGPFECVEGYITQYYKTQQQKDALEAWQRGFSESEFHKQRPLTLTPEESQEASDILAEVHSYIDPMRVKFITGEEPIENFDAYVEKAYSLGLQRALDIYTEAYRRYNNR